MKNDTALEFLGPPFVTHKDKYLLKYIACLFSYMNCFVIPFSNFAVFLKYFERVMMVGKYSNWARDKG